VNPANISGVGSGVAVGVSAGVGEAEGVGVTDGAAVTVLLGSTVGMGVGATEGLHAGEMTALIRKIKSSRFPVWVVLWEFSIGSSSFSIMDDSELTASE